MSRLELIANVGGGVSCGSRGDMELVPWPWCCGIGLRALIGPNPLVLSLRVRQKVTTPIGTFAFRKTLGIDAPVLPIQVEHQLRGIAASTPLPPLADWLAVTKAQD